MAIDLNNVLGLYDVNSTKAAKHSTNISAGNGLQMDDFLELMVATLKYQSIDDTADTTEMMNQMVQMSVVQAITNISTLFTENSNLSYAASLVGKEVTIGQYIGNSLREIVGTVTGTGTLDGEQIIFLGNDSYYLSDVLAVGRLPERTEQATAGAATGEQRGSGQQSAQTSEEESYTVSGVPTI